MERSLAELESIVRDRICHVCTERTDTGECGREDPSGCALFRLFPQVAKAIQSVKSDDIHEYIEAIRRRGLLRVRRSKLRRIVRRAAGSALRARRLSPPGGGRHRGSYRQSPLTGAAYASAAMPLSGYGRNSGYRTILEAL